MKRRYAGVFGALILLSFAAGLFFFARNEKSDRSDSLHMFAHAELMSDQRIEDFFRPSLEKTHDGAALQLSDLGLRELGEGEVPLYYRGQRGTKDWWVFREMRAGQRRARFTVRPNDEFLEGIWLNDFNLQNSFEEIDVRNPPVKAELVIPY